MPSQKNKTFGYVRAEFGEQELKDQIETLNRSDDKPDFIYKEVTNNSDWIHPELSLAIKFLIPGDIFIVTSLDRLFFKNRYHTFQILSEFLEIEVSIVLISENLDTRIKDHYELLQFMLSYINSERERHRILAKEGYQAALANGTKMGRPRALTFEQAEAARDMKLHNSWRKIAKFFGVSVTTVQNAVTRINEGIN